MRKISIDAAEAFHNGECFLRDNTEVTTVQHSEYVKVRLALFGNVIAVLYKYGDGAWQDDVVKINNQGYCTPTTKDRLNAVLDSLNLSIVQHKKKWFINGFRMPFDNWVSPREIKSKSMSMPKNTTSVKTISGTTFIKADKHTFNVKNYEGKQKCKVDGEFTLNEIDFYKNIHQENEIHQHSINY